MTALTDKPLSNPIWVCNPDMDAAPTGRKLIAINHGGVACFAVITNHNRGDFQQWAPLPKLAKANS